MWGGGIVWGLFRSVGWAVGLTLASDPLLLCSVNAFPTGNLFFLTILLAVSIGMDVGALKGVPFFFFFAM